MKFRAFFSALALAAATTVAAEDIPLRNWTPAAFPSTPSTGRTALADIGGPVAFIPMTPCRAVDTRNANGPFGGPAFSAAETRTYNFTGSTCTGFPTNVAAYSVNFTVTDTGGPGFLAAYPHGTPPSPLVSTINYVGGQTIANAAVVPAVSNQIDVVAGVSGTNVVIDINGYYAYTLNGGELFWVWGAFSGGPAIQGWNNGNSSNSSGVKGVGNAGGSPTSGTNFGVWGEVSGNVGLNSAGVYGLGRYDAGTGFVTWGVLGEGEGIQSPTNIGLFGTGGVLGRGTVLGTLGIANYPTPSTLGSRGAIGCVKNSAGTSFQVCGIAGMISADGGTTYGLFSQGNTGATGTKSFVEPHPYEPGKVIRYVSLEGPEAGTYFRGSARSVDGVAVIEVPESFRLVTDADGLTVQVTPRGAQPTATSVETSDLTRIVVRTTRDVEFSYLVQGVRKGFRDFQVIAEGDEYRPAGPDATLPAYLSEEQKKSLVRSGVYNEDGTVNLGTADRMGWTRQWREQAARAH